MSRRALAWLLPLPLVALGSLGAHTLVYRLAAGASTGHVHGAASGQPPGAWYACAGICGAAALVVLAGVALASARRGTALRAPLWIVVLVPPLGFTAQEELGRLVHAGALTAVPLQASFLLGLLLQVPVALLALILVRALLRTAADLVSALRPREPRRRASRAARRFARSALAPSFPALALGYGERGPPALSLT